MGRYTQTKAARGNVVNVKVDDATLRRIEKFCMENGFLRLDGGPSVSAGLHAMITIALRDPEGQQIIRTAYQMAKGHIQQQVSIRHRQLLDQLFAEFNVED